MYFTYEPDLNNMNDYGIAPNYRLILHTDKLPEVVKKPILETDDTTYWYGETDEGFVSFGISHNYRTFNHEAGYMWSSRASVFNGMFPQDISCKEVSIQVEGTNGRYGHLAMTLEAIYSLLDEDKEIAIYQHWNDNEIRLEIFDRFDSTNDLHGDGTWLLIDTITKIMADEP